MTNALMKVTDKETFTSIDIAEWTGKQHKNVLADIEDEMEKLGEVGKLIFQLSSYKTDANTKPYKMYEMDKDGVMQIAARYDAKVRYGIIQKLKEVEKPSLPTNLKEAYLMLAKQEEEKEQLALERDTAIQTKAEIGSRREATSMQTASVAVRKVNKLSDQINKLTDNEKRPDEYTTFEAARHIGVFSIDYKGIVKKPHMMLVASIFNTLKDTDNYGRKVKSDINGHIVDTIYVNDLFVEEASDFIRKYESEGCITLKGRDYKFRLVR
ncbi:MAG: Rha family transcriptional regulator [Syntrophothermus sp.]